MSGHAVQEISDGAEVTGAHQALVMNISAAKSLMDLLKTNLGPKGTLKMLVGGAGDVKITKDGNVLLREMSIQHPTAMLVARSATAVDEAIGDGTTTQVLMVGEILRQCEQALAEGVHPRNLTEGLDLARAMALERLEELKVECRVDDKERLLAVARCSLRTKVEVELADALAPMVVDACLLIRREGRPLDLFMVELMSMTHRHSLETRLVRGLVLDHGGRHPQMPKDLKKCFVLTMNVSLEYEKTEVNSEAIYASAEERDRLALSERKFIDDRVRRVIDLKRSVCDEEEGTTFVVVNQKGIDPPSLDMLAKEGILALRRAKRRNMERLTLACGGQACNSVDDLHPSVLGRAEHVYEQVLGEDKFTFVEGVSNPFSCTILLKGPSRHAVEQTKDAVRDGLRAVKNTLQDQVVCAGGGATEMQLYEALMKKAPSVTGRARLGVEAMANALLVIPKTLARNSGYDATDVVLSLRQHSGLGLDLNTGEAADMAMLGVWDLYRVKRQTLHSATVLASQLLLVDEVLRATGPQQPGGRR